MTSTSPLRYPGGKARFTKFISDSIICSGDVAKVFVEPFCGGAGAAIALLETGKVPQIALNDCDPLIGSFWRIVFGKSRRSRIDIDWLIQNIENTELSIAEWTKLKGSIPTNERMAAWKCLYLNRTSFNGIIHKAGPIGGWSQEKRKIDARFNREKLVARLNSLYDLRDCVVAVEAFNWRKFCSLFAKKKGTYLYLDPPYFNRAEQLYGYVFDEKSHQTLRTYLGGVKRPWMLSYDDAPEIRALYESLTNVEGRVIDQTYSSHPVGGASFIGRELFFSNRRLPNMFELAKGSTHVGLSVLGSTKQVKSVSSGPLRVPTPSSVLTP